MKSFLATALLLAATFCAGQARAEDVSLTYVLTIDHPETGIARVLMTVDGLSAQGITLERSTAAGEGWFDQIRAANAAGELLTVVPVEAGWYVTTAGAPRVSLTYVIKPGEISSGQHLGLIAADYAALDGSFVFLTPSTAQSIKRVSVTFDVPRNWKPIIAWPQSGGVYSPDASFAPLDLQLSSSLMCFGDFVGTSKKFGSNDVAVFAPAACSAADRETLAAMLFKIYGRIYDILGCDTGRPYNVVCLPVAPDGLPTVAGAWADGQALTLIGSFSPDDAIRFTEYFARYVANAYFGQQPFGVRLTGKDLWLYFAFRRYAEGIAVTSAAKLSENLFYASIYEDYSALAVANDSSVDIAPAELESASYDAADFIRRTKAVILLMRLDLEIRTATGGKQNVETFLTALYARGRNWAPGIRAFDVLKSSTGVDFSDFEDKFVKSRMLLLPTWPAFISRMTAETAPAPGPVAANVDGVPIYEREVDMMANALMAEGNTQQPDLLHRTALAALIDEKLMDAQLAAYNVSVIPEAFWRLRLVLPARVTTLVVAAKRQALHSLLYDDWLTTARKSSAVEIVPVKKTAPSATLPQAAPVPAAR